MKLLKLSIVFLLALSLNSCEDDEPENNCVQSDWIGNYEGTKTTTLDDGSISEGTLTMTIVADGTENIEIEYVYVEAGGTLTTTLDPLKPDFCNIDKSITVGTESATIVGSLNGNDLEITETFNLTGGSFVCEISATKI